jgi:hypothetical protein
MNFLKRLEKRLRWKRAALKNLSGTLDTLFDVLLHQQAELARQRSPNPLAAAGAKAYSQADEDGITLEILRRIGKLEGGVYAEFGVGDGTENNSLVLAALGWRGFWVGGQDLVVRTPPESARHFRYLKAWITLDNIVALAREGLQAVQAPAPDVISLDLDGNDLYFVRALLEAGLQPALFIVEYNAKFPPPVKFTIDYDPQHQWLRDDHFGASLASFAELFAAHGYRLVCCNSGTGSNAFFVAREHAHRFADVPVELERLYVGPRYWLPKKNGHAASLRTIEKILGGP